MECMESVRFCGTDRVLFCLCPWHHSLYERFRGLKAGHPQATVPVGGASCGPVQPPWLSLVPVLPWARRGLQGVLGRFKSLGCLRGLFCVWRGGGGRGGADGVAAVYLCAQCPARLRSPRPRRPRAWKWGAPCISPSPRHTMRQDDTHRLGCPTARASPRSATCNA